ncbi:hypothetical protein F5888DRAFT_1630583 [Russula emetica]|nr:hypothetical protein F5888DRAFT_1630583 [Russula emetica]
MVDDINQSKRRLTHHPHTDTQASTSQLSHSISPDLNARLQNIGSRIRRSVSEGYATHRFSPTSIQAEGQASINDAPIFRSSNDTLHAVYSQFSTSALVPSDKKRGRMEPTVDERDEQSEDGSAAVQSASVITANDLACSRPIKPLRRSPRTFGQTKSLPATVFASSGGGDQPSVDAGIWEEEDWSASAFSGETVNTQRLD